MSKQPYLITAPSCSIKAFVIAVHVSFLLLACSHLFSMRLHCSLPLHASVVRTCPDILGVDLSMAIYELGHLTADSDVFVSLASQTSWQWLDVPLQWTLHCHWHDADPSCPMESDALRSGYLANASVQSARVLYSTSWMNDCERPALAMGFRSTSRKVWPLSFSLEVCSRSFASPQKRAFFAIVLCVLLALIVFGALLSELHLGRSRGLQPVCICIVPAALCSCNPPWLAATFTNDNGDGQLAALTGELCLPLGLLTSLSFVIALRLEQKRLMLQHDDPSEGLERLPVSWSSIWYKLAFVLAFLAVVGCKAWSVFHLSPVLYKTAFFDDADRDYAAVGSYSPILMPLRHIAPFRNAGAIINPVDLLPLIPVLIAIQHLKRDMANAPMKIAREQNLLLALAIVQKRAALNVGGFALLVLLVRQCADTLTGRGLQLDDNWSALLGALSWEPSMLSMLGWCGLAISNVMALLPSAQDADYSTQPLNVRIPTLQTLLHCCYVSSKKSAGSPDEVALGVQQYTGEPQTAHAGLKILATVSVRPEMDLFSVILSWERRAKGCTELIVVHRGTTSLESLYVDLRAKREVHPELEAAAAALRREHAREHHRRRSFLMGTLQHLLRWDTPVEVHRGFKMSMRAYEEKGLTELVKLHAANSGAKRIWFAGHSLGGGLAALHAAEFALQNPDLAKFSVVTFGAPHVGNRAFISLFSHLVGHRLRVVNCRDPIVASGKYGIVHHWRSPYHHFSPALHFTDIEGHAIINPTMLEKIVVLRSGRLSIDALFAYFFIPHRIAKLHQMKHYGWGVLALDEQRSRSAVDLLPSASAKRASVESEHFEVELSTFSAPLPLAALMAEQIEAASMVLLSKMDLAKEEDLRAAEELVVALNPSAKVVQAREGVVEQPEALWETTFEEGDVVVAADASNAYSRKSAADKYGIKTFTYTARRPFITAAFMQLLHEMQEDCSKDDYIQRAGLLRMKGVCWLTSEPAKEHRLNYAGRNYRTMAVAPWFAVCDETYLDMRLAHPIDREAYQRVKSYAWDDGGWGDRRQELVCIGGRGMDVTQQQRRLDACLVDDTAFEAFSNAQKDHIVDLGELFPGLD